MRYRTGGRGSQQRRYTIGPTGAVSLAEARKIAGKVLSDVRLGHDPAAEKRARAEASNKATTVAELLERHEAGQRARGVVTAGATASDAPPRFCRSDRREPRSPDRDADGSWSSASSVCATACAATPRRALGSRRPSAPGSTASSRPASRAATSTLNPLAGFREPRQSRAQRLEQAAKRAGRMLSMDEIAALWAACGDHRIRPAFGAYVRALDRARLAPGRDRHGAAVMDQVGDERIGRRFSFFRRR